MFDTPVVFLGAVIAFLLFVVVIGVLTDSPAKEEERRLDNERKRLEIELLREKRTPPSP